MYYSHTPNDEGHGNWHGLAEHLRGVAAKARRFAESFGGGALAYWLGLIHDIGKYSDEFQGYLYECHRAQLAGEVSGGRGPDHSSTGAWLAFHLFGTAPLAAIVAGHHGGLPGTEHLHTRLASRDEHHIRNVISQGLAEVSELDETDELDIPAPFASNNNLQLEMFHRFLFSALVDADYLDTEAHFDLKLAEARKYGSNHIQSLQQRFMNEYELKFGRATITDPRTVNDVRHVVFNRCLETARAAPGMFRLTVPTGGGKTLSSLAFALEHAVEHDLERVIIAIPFTSIIEQTATEYRRFLGTDVVLEHHSMVDEPNDLDGRADIGAVRMRLAAENWDMPVVVTTTVQLFDSLFSNRPRACRKLHRLARSVLVLDEVQSLPGHYLAPILDVLQELVTNYGSSVVLCTATQPEYTTADVPMRLDVREIVPEYTEHFRLLRRVDYKWEPREWSWEDVATHVEEHPQILVIVNSRKDAQRLLDDVKDLDHVYHLSANLCPLHRQTVLANVRWRLKAKKPVRLIATQVVEAGVDIDFPFVMRALGPLPSMVQAAGRCNREGGADKGTVVLFDPADGHLPPQEYATATATALQLLKQGKDLNDPEIFRTYFHKLYSAIDQDSESIQPLRERFDYPEVARRFRLIADETEPVVVRYALETEKDKLEDEIAIGRLLQQARWAGLSRRLMRQLNGYMVNLHPRQFEAAQKRGQIHEVVPGLNVWYGEYDAVRGLVGKGLDAATSVI